jgi:hypothetical protein
MATVAPDSPAHVVAYLDRRRCVECGTSLSSVFAADVTRSQHSPKWRCSPPPPTCWEFVCPGCEERITIWVRKGKAGPLYPSRVSRRSPLRHNEGG